MSNCPYCGPKSIPHFSNWLESSLGIFLSPLDNLVLGSSVHWILSRLFRPLAIPFTKLLIFLKIARLNPDFEKANPRIQVLAEEAKKRGIEMQSLDVFDKNIDYYLARLKNKTIIFNGLPRPPHLSGRGLWWMDDKKILKTKLQINSLPTPQGQSFTRLAPALKYFKKLPKPVVAKPRVGSRGRHTLTHIRTEKDFKHAFKIAKQLCYWVVIEEHLAGPVYRGTVVGGKLIGVLGGSPPQITGDGKHSIQKLIEIKNQTKPASVKDFRISETTPEFLNRLGYTLESVLENKKTIDLTEKIGVNYGGSSFEITPETHPGFKIMLEKAAVIINDSILGFDFIAPNIQKSPEEQKWGIIECNSLPFINLHHDPLIGKPINAAGYIWDLWVN